MSPDFLPEEIRHATQVSEVDVFGTLYRQLPEKQNVQGGDGEMTPGSAGHDINR